MSEIAELTLESLRKNRTFMISFGIFLGLHVRELLESLWETGNIGLAWSNWVAKGLPQVPGTFVMLAIAFGVVIAWEVGKRSQEDGYTMRTDGYRSNRDD